MATPHYHSKPCFCLFKTRFDPACSGVCSEARTSGARDAPAKVEFAGALEPQCSAAEPTLEVHQRPSRTRPSQTVRRRRRTSKSSSKSGLRGAKSIEAPPPRTLDSFSRPNRSALALPAATDLTCANAPRKLTNHVVRNVNVLCPKLHNLQQTTAHVMSIPLRSPAWGARPNDLLVRAGTRVLVTLCTNNGSKALHVFVHCAGSSRTCCGARAAGSKRIITAMVTHTDTHLLWLRRATPPATLSSSGARERAELR